MTIYDIKTRTQEKQPYFFTRETMRFFHQTMRDFKIKKQPDGKYLISAPMKDNNGKVMGITKRLFNPETNNLEHAE